MDKDEMLQELSAFICDNGQWNAFMDKMRSKGFTEEELKPLEDL